MVDYFQVGIITQPHGVKGEVKVFSTTDDLNRFKKLKNCFLDTPKGRIPAEVEGVKFFKQFAILKFKGYDDMNSVECLRKVPIMVDRANAVKLKENEFFIADLIGVKVYDENDKYLGIMDDCLSTGANDVYVIKMENGYELMLPAIKDCILERNPEEGYMKVHVLDGLMDL